MYGTLNSYSTAGAIVLRISHGYEVRENNDPFIDLADRAVDQFSHATAPGAFMVDIMPFCKTIRLWPLPVIGIIIPVANVPEWFPGAGFKRLAREWSKTRQDMAAIPYGFVKDQMVIDICGFAIMSWTFHRLLALPRCLSPQICWKAVLYLRRRRMWRCGLLQPYTLAVPIRLSPPSISPYFETNTYLQTVSPIYSFFLAMTLFPDVQKKAQAEIDTVVGSDLLPSFTDRDSLPYTEVLVKEVFRWSVVGPTGMWISFITFLNCRAAPIAQLIAMFHRVTEDDIHDEYYIPKGSLVIPNIWLVLLHFHIRRANLIQIQVHAQWPADIC
jgi:hypothetical protein